MINTNWIVGRGKPLFGFRRSAYISNVAISFSLLINININICARLLAYFHFTSFTFNQHVKNINRIHLFCLLLINLFELVEVHQTPKKVLHTSINALLDFKLNVRKFYYSTLRLVLIEGFYLFEADLFAVNSSQQGKCLNLCWQISIQVTSYFRQVYWSSYPPNVKWNLVNQPESS